MTFSTVSKQVYTYLCDKFQTDPFGGQNFKKSQGYSPCFLMNFKQYFHSVAKIAKCQKTMDYSLGVFSNFDQF